MSQAARAHILIAYDDQSFGAAMREAIEREGILAVDMPRTLAARMIVPHWLPAAVIIDVGGECDPGFFPVVARLQADPRTVNLPIIVCTANASAVPITGGRTMILTKPCAIAEIVAAVKQLLTPMHWSENDAPQDAGPDIAYMDILLTEARAGARSLDELMANRETVEPLYRYVDEALGALQKEVNHWARQHERSPAKVRRTTQAHPPEEEAVPSRPQSR